MPFDVPFIRPVFPSSSLIGRDFDEIVESNWYTNFGPKERAFSSAISEYLGGDGLYAVTFSNATAGLMAALACVLGRGNGDLVIVPTFTFAAGPAAIEWSGYRPLLIDIDPVSLQPSIEDAQAALSNPELAIAGILLCNTFGIGNSSIDDWVELARAHAVPLVIDSAAGFGSLYGPDRFVGTAGRAEIFSFHATKPFAIGEGGAVVTHDRELAERLESFQNFGFAIGRGASMLGLNAKLQEINAAIGLRQLAVFDQVLAGRRAVQREYIQRLEPSGIRFPTNVESSSVCFASALFPNTQWRDSARDALIQSGVEVREYYSPLIHVQPHFVAASRVSDVAHADQVASTILSIPVYHDMAGHTVSRITEAILGVRS